MTGPNSSDSLTTLSNSTRCSLWQSSPWSRQGRYTPIIGITDLSPSSTENLIPQIRSEVMPLTGVAPMLLCHRNYQFPPKPLPPSTSSVSLPSAFPVAHYSTVEPPCLYFGLKYIQQTTPTCLSPVNPELPADITRLIHWASLIHQASSYRKVVWHIQVLHGVCTAWWQ